MMRPHYIGIDPESGLAIFETPDGQRVMVDHTRSATARALMMAPRPSNEPRFHMSDVSKAPSPVSPYSPMRDVSKAPPMPPSRRR